MMLSAEDSAAAALSVPTENDANAVEKGANEKGEAGKGVAGKVEGTSETEGGEGASRQRRRSSFEVPPSEMRWSGASVTAGSVSKVYIYRSRKGIEHRIVLRHDTFTGNLALLVDGEERLAENNTAGMINMGGALQATAEKIPFSLSGVQGLLSLRVIANEWVPIPAKVEYALIIDGECLMDEASNPATSKSRKSDFKVWVTSAETTGDSVTWYRIDSKRASTGMEVAVHRRFSDFHNVAMMVSSYFKDSQLLQVLPTPPPKGLKFLQNHLDPEFIEERRRSCEAYLRKLLSVPRVSGFGEVHDFLGHAGPGLRETSLVFPAGAFGIKIAKQGVSSCRAGIVDFNPVNGEPGIAERSGRLAIGDSISRVAGESVADMPYNSILRQIGEAQRPVVIHFLGYEVKAQAKPDSEGPRSATGE